MKTKIIPFLLFAFTFFLQQSSTAQCNIEVEYAYGFCYQYAEIYVVNPDPSTAGSYYIDVFGQSYGPYAYNEQVILDNVFWDYGVYDILIIDADDPNCIIDYTLWIECDPIIELQGPSQLCMGECGTYELIDFNTGQQPWGDWVIYANGVTIDEIQGNSYVFCPQEPGSYTIEVNSFSPNGQTFYDEIYVTVGQSGNIDILSSSTTACLGSADSMMISCEKVCANSTVTYSVYTPGGTVENPEWTIQGAEDYTVEGNQVIVEWGSPGAGQISVQANTTQPPASELACFNYVLQPGIEFTAYLEPDVPSGPDYVYEWIDQDGLLISTTINTVVYNAGTYTLTVTNVTDGSSSSCTSTVYFNGNCNTLIDLEGSVTNPSSCQSCDGAAFVSIANGSAPFSYAWSNGSTTQSVTGLCAGIYEVTVTDSEGCFNIESFNLTCSDNSTCPSIAELCIDIIEEPEAIVATTPPADANGVINVCEGQTVYFENQSTNAEYYTWDLGTGEIIESANISHVYDEAGTYLAMLIAQNECLCSDTLVMTIEVEDAISPDIGCAGTICAGESVTYTSDADCGTFNWTVENGTITDGGGTSDDFVSVDWGNGPVGIVELLVDNCTGDYCIEAAIYQIPILSASTIIEGPREVCREEVATYTTPDYGGTEFTWTVSGLGTITAGQGTNHITVEWANAFSGDEWVSVEFGSCYLECGGEETIEIDILPEFFIAGPIESCQNGSTQYTTVNVGNGSAVSCDWEVIAPDGSTFTTASNTSSFDVDWTTTAGTYTVIATTTDPTSYCEDDYSILVDVINSPPTPTLITGTDLVCPGEFYTYEGFSTQLGNSYKWYITDGSNNYVKEGNPINISWGATGPYQLSVAQISGNGLPCESDTITKEIFPIQTLDLTGNDLICIEDIGTYSASSYDQVEYEWSVSPTDAGSIIEGEDTDNVDILFHKSGPATIEVSMCGLTETFIVNVPPNPEPVVNHPVGLCQNETTVVSTTIPFAAYQWTNENGTVVSNDPTPMLGPGHYDLEVTDDDGCRGRTPFHIIPFATPEIGISTPLNLGLCPGASSTLYALQTDAGYSYQWYYNNAPVGTDSPTYTTDEYGSYYVTVVDQNGCMANSNLITFISCADAGGICIGGLCAVQIDGPPVPGCTPSGALDFEIQTTADCAEHNFINTSTNGIPGTFFWNFDDPGSVGNNIAADNPSHTYANGAGFYTITMIGDIQDVNDPTLGCTMLFQKPDTVLAQAGFEAFVGCLNEATAFVDISTFLPITTIGNWQWDFGDPASGADNTSTLVNPIHIYNAPGNYQVSLTITDASGCESTKTKTITIDPLPDVMFAPPTENCQATSLNFIASTSAPNVVAYEWDFGDPASGAANTATKENTYHVYETPGTYTVSVTAITINGCPNTFTSTVEIEPNNLTGDITFSNPPPICEGESTTMFAPMGGTEWEWSTGATTSSINTFEAGTFDVTITDAEGCTYSPSSAVVDIIPAPSGAIRVVEFNEYGQPENYEYDGFTACEGTDVNLQIIGDDGYTYTWSEGTSGDELFFTDDRGNLLSAGSYDFTVTITDTSTGCTAIEGTFNVTINPLPNDVVITSSPAGVLCNNDPATISVSNPNASYQYVWSTGALGTSINTTIAGDYSVIAVNEFGCEAESNIITINEGPDLNRIPSGCHTRCGPDTLCLPDMPTITDYQWYFNDMLIPAPEGTVDELIIEESGEYYVILTDASGCTATSGLLTIDLYDAFGTIEGNVYFDVNDNGIIDGPDTLMNNIDIYLTDGTTALDTVDTGSNGSYAFSNILSTEYVLVFDTMSLPPNWSPYESVITSELIGCDDEEEVNWLVHEVCVPSIASAQLYGCPNSTVEFYGEQYDVNSVNEVTVPGLLCDTIYTLTVDELDTSSFLIQENACEGTSYDYNGTMVLAGTQQNFTYTNYLGCDSIVTVDVGELLNTSNTISLQACTGSTVDYNGNQLSPNTSNEYTYTNANGCDSLVTVIVEELLEDMTALTLAACDGATVMYDGAELSPNTTTNFTFPNVNGCDSTVAVTVEEIPTTYSSVQMEACEGESILYNGTTVMAGQQEIFTLTGAQGCDSVVTLTVGEILVPLSVEELFVCDGEMAFYDNQELEAGSSTTFTYTSSLGCDSIVDVSVTSYPPLLFSVEHNGPNCWNAFDAELSINNPFGGTPPYEYSIAGNNYQPGEVFSNLSAGYFEVKMRDANGCIQIQEIEIPEILPINVQIEDVTFACEADSVVLNPQVTSGNTAALTYTWDDGSNRSLHPVFAPGTYLLNVSNECETVQKEIKVALEEDGRTDFIYVPNVFTPNGDGFNDIFKIEPASNVEIIDFRFHIYDRWGTTILTLTDFSQGWDGRYQNKMKGEGMYVWYIEATISTCGRTFDVMKGGDVGIVR